MRIVCLVLVVSLVSCKEKQDAKPPPAPGSAAGPVVAQASDASVGEATLPPEPTKPPIKPAGGINTTAEYEAKAFDLMDKLTAVFGAAGTNCDKLADGLEVFIDTNQAAITSTEQFQ